MELKLLRDHYHTECTEGRLFVGDEMFYTIERPWIPVEGCKSGKKSESCVATGKYDLKPHQRPVEKKGKMVWALVNPDLDVYYVTSHVPEKKRGKARTLILAHVACFVDDIAGCIGPGLERTMMPNMRKPPPQSPERAVKFSGAAMNRMREILGPGSEGHTIVIKDATKKEADEPVVRVASDEVRPLGKPKRGMFQKMTSFFSR